MHENFPCGRSLFTGNLYISGHFHQAILRNLTYIRKKSDLIKNLRVNRNMNNHKRKSYLRRRVLFPGGFIKSKQKDFVMQLVFRDKNVFIFVRYIYERYLIF